MIFNNYEILTNENYVVLFQIPVVISFSPVHFNKYTAGLILESAQHSEFNSINVQEPCLWFNSFENIQKHGIY